MTQASGEASEKVREVIAGSDLSIYDVISPDHLCFLSIEALEYLLAKYLRGLSLSYPIRTRAKVAKGAVCEALGYPVPSTFRKTQPRFPGQDLDIYVQKSNNLQIWNEEISPGRRYGLLRLDSEDRIIAVRVLAGEVIAQFDRTGTMTRKYQARRDGGRGSKLVSETDTERFRRALRPGDLTAAVLREQLPPDPPRPGMVLSVTALWAHLHRLMGSVVSDPGLDQERNRGAGLQRAVCEALELKAYRDEGQFPDMRCQALEVKLQTSPTIDLGLVSPDSVEPIEGLGGGLRHCDMRHAVFYGVKADGACVRLTELVVTTGADFFTEFTRFGGLVQNRKLQLPLPTTLFGEAE